MTLMDKDTCTARGLWLGMLQAATPTAGRAVRGCRWGTVRHVCDTPCVVLGHVQYDK